MSLLSPIVADKTANTPTYWAVVGQVYDFSASVSRASYLSGGETSLNLDFPTGSALVTGSPDWRGTDPNHSVRELVRFERAGTFLIRATAAHDRTGYTSSAAITVRAFDTVTAAMAAKAEYDRDLKAAVAGEQRTTAIRDVKPGGGLPTGAPAGMAQISGVAVTYPFPDYRRYPLRGIEIELWEDNTAWPDTKLAGPIHTVEATTSRRCGLDRTETYMSSDWNMHWAASDRSGEFNFGNISVGSGKKIYFKVRTKFFSGGDGSTAGGSQRIAVQDASGTEVSFETGRWDVTSGQNLNAAVFPALLRTDGTVEDEAIHVYYDLSRAFGYFRDCASFTPWGVSARIDLSSTEGPNSPGSVINFPRWTNNYLTTHNTSVITHEYGHSVHYFMNGGSYPSLPSGDDWHKGCSNSRTTASLVEGWAEFVPAGIANAPKFIWDVDPGFDISNDGATSSACEGKDEWSFAGALWDLWTESGMSLDPSFGQMVGTLGNHDPAFVETYYSWYISDWGRCQNTWQIFKNHNINYSPCETVSTPNPPSGSQNGLKSTSYTYTASGASSSVNHALQYYFDWGDTTNSGWLVSGTTSASHSWSTTGVYPVKIKARCSIHTIESNWSNALTVTIANETVSPPSTPSGASSGMVGTSYPYTTRDASSSAGHSVQYRFDWGDGQISDWLAVGTTGWSHTWTSPNSYSVKAQARCATDTSIVSAWSSTATVNISQTYYIQGTTRLSDGSALSGVGLALTGASSDSKTSGASGAYSFTGLAPGTYTVAPSKPGYTCSPSSRSYSPLNSNRLGEDYTCTINPTYSIQGTITDGSGALLSGVLVGLTGAATSSMTTGAGGAYAFNTLAPGNYTVTPTKAGYNCVPVSRSYSPLNSNRNGENYICAAIGPPVYSIQGTVMDASSGAPMSGVLVSLTGVSTSSVTTGAAGTYAFYNLVQGNYTITPSRSGYNFTPGSRVYSPLNSDRTGDNFAGSAVPSDGCTLESAHPYANNFDYTWTCTVAGASALNVAFDSQTLIESGWDFIHVMNGAGVPIQGSPFTGNSLAGQTKSITGNAVRIRLTSDGIITSWGFKAVVSNGGASGFTVRGTVREPGGAALSGVNVTLSGTGTGAVTTGMDGAYSFASLPQGNYTVIPAKSGYTCVPVSRSYAPLNSDRSGEDYTCSVVIQPRYYVQGVVADASGTPISGVLVTLSGASTGTVTTGGAGTYRFQDLPQGNYTVTPSKSNYTFTPGSRVYSPLNQDRTADNFTGTPTNTGCTLESVHPYADNFDYTWTCTVTGASALNVAFDTQTYVESNWDYIHVSNGSGIPIPGSPFTGSALAGQTKTVSGNVVRIRLISDAYVTGWGFKAVVAQGTGAGYTIRGTVRQPDGTPLSGVTLSLSGASTGSLLTGADGAYAFLNFAQGSYTVTPSKSGYSCTPVSRSYAPLNSDRNGEDYTCSVLVQSGYVIQGMITESGAPLSGVLVTLSGASTGSVTTGIAGTYRFQDLPQGNYTVTPSRTDYSFTPASRVYSPLNQDRTADNFTGTRTTGTTCTVESAHPYSDNFDYTWACTVPGASSLNVTFDPQTYVEYGWDFISVMNGSNVPIAGSPFTGSSLAGQTKTVTGNVVRVRLISDQFVTGWGFRAGGGPPPPRGDTRSAAPCD